MKKLFTFIAIASLGIFAAHAQELDIEADAPEYAEQEALTQEDSLAAHHKTNIKLFVDAGIGVDYMPFGKAGVATPLFVGAWFDPMLGARIGIQGFGQSYRGNLTILKTDAMWNVTRTFNEAEDVGNFEWVLYASAGAMFYKGGTDFCVGAGSQFLFRLTENLQILADVPLISEFDPENKGKIPYFSIPQIGISAGVRYQF